MTVQKVMTVIQERKPQRRQHGSSYEGHGASREFFGRLVGWSKDKSDVITSEEEKLVWAFTHRSTVTSQTMLSYV